MKTKILIYRFTVDSHVAGIPCKLGVTEVGYYTPATYGGRDEDAEPEDACSHSYDILDRRGYRAAWLDVKCSTKDCEQHQLDIDNYLKEFAHDY